MYNVYQQSKCFIKNKYNETRVWTLDGHVFYKARICGAERQLILIYNYDTPYYVFIFALLKLLNLIDLYLLETPENIILDYNAINVYAYYSSKKLHGVMHYSNARQRRQRRTPPPILYVMIDDILNVTREYELFRPSIDGAMMKATEMMELLWLFKHRHQISPTPPPMKTISIILDKSFKEQVFKSDDIILLEDE
jgi:hypothetical protein